MFGCVRSHGGRYCNCTAFAHSFKTLLINNIMSAHSQSSNCEKDDCTQALDSLKNLIIEENKLSTEEESQDLQHLQDDENGATFKSSSTSVIQTHAYIAGYIAKKVFKRIGPCFICRNLLLSKTNEEEHVLIKARAYQKHLLLRPDSNFRSLFSQCTQVTHYYLLRVCNTNLIMLEKY